ncbi:MAG: branched-chain amino acid aminotransferase [Deltaproteobacteria bacterium]|jgi:branched-chain amino acid aminotransferase|nr:branched-chain amino acid aminotransferase [Deltaproteobacteria bacterium]
MEISYNALPPERRRTPPPKVETFGKIRTDHMFVADYRDGAWRDPRITPYGPFALPPGAACLHYGQTLFEGAKAFRHADGEVYVWRFDENMKRLNHSASVLMMPEVPEELQLEGLLRLIDLERGWCPEKPECSLYIRPLMFAVQDMLAVKPSKTYIFCIMLSPSGPYYAGGFDKAITLLITGRYHRAVSGGTGTAKCAGNYAASLRPAGHAANAGAEQVLYLDASNTYLEEAGSMNHFHVLADGTFVIPQFNDSVLRSITSLSVLELAAQGRLRARQEKIALKNFVEGLRSGEIIEAGGLGTAAVISPVNRYLFEDGSSLIVGDGKIGRHSRDLYELYSRMQFGSVPAPEGWLRRVPSYEK